MDPFSLAMGGIGLIGNVVGGLFGKSAADKAAAIQQQASKAASDKVGVATGEANAGIADATQRGQNLITTGANRVLDTAGAAKAGMDEQTKNANALLDPYSAAGEQAAGTLQAGLKAGGDFNKPVTMADLQMDPGFAWRLQQGQIALDRSAAARGGALSGEAARAMAGYSQGLASQEYQHAFDRYQTDVQGRYTRLFGEQGLGANAAQQQGNNLTAAARYGGDITTGAANTNLDAGKFSATLGLEGANQIGANTLTGAKTAADYLTGGANAAAAGKVGGANAIGGAIAGGANAVSSALTLGKLLKNPAVSAVRVI